MSTKLVIWIIISCIIAGYLGEKAGPYVANFLNRCIDSVKKRNKH